MKAFADDTLNVTIKVEFVFKRVENIMGQGENADCKHFLFFPQFYQRPFFFRVVKSQDCEVKG